MFFRVVVRKPCLLPSMQRIMPSPSMAATLSPTCNGFGFGEEGRQQAR